MIVYNDVFERILYKFSGKEETIMKKLLKLITVLAVVSLLSVLVFGTAFAAESPVGGTGVIAAESDGDDVLDAVTVGESGVGLTAAEAAKIIGGDATEGNTTILWGPKDVKCEFLPVDLTFGAEGNDGPLYLFHYDGEWKIVKEGSGATITGTFDSLSPIALVTYSTEEEIDPDDAPKTYENNILLYLAVAAVLLGTTAVFAAYKRTAKN